MRQTAAARHLFPSAGIPYRLVISFSPLHTHTHNFYFTLRTFKLNELSQHDNQMKLSGSTCSTRFQHLYFRLLIGSSPPGGTRVTCVIDWLKTMSPVTSRRSCAESFRPGLDPALDELKVISVWPFVLCSCNTKWPFSDIAQVSPSREGP